MRTYSGIFRPDAPEFVLQIHNEDEQVEFSAQKIEILQPAPESKEESPEEGLFEVPVLIALVLKGKNPDCFARHLLLPASFTRRHDKMSLISRVKFV